jgi:hypothetical protein
MERIKLINIPTQLIDACRGIEELPGIDTERGRYCMGFLSLMYVDTLMDMARKRAGESDAKVINKFAGVLNQTLSEGVAGVDVRTRVVRKQDEYSLVQGEHPGVYMGIKCANGTTVHVNLFGGIRDVSCMDHHDTTNQHKKGLGHGGRTGVVGSKDMIVNIMVQPDGGNRLASCQFTVHNNGDNVVVADRFSVYKERSRIVEVESETRQKIRIDDSTMGGRMRLLANSMAKSLPMI